MEVLAAVREVRPPNWLVGSGVIRNLVWDHLHGYSERTPVNDVDVVFFDRTDVSRERDSSIEAELTERSPEVPWEVTNQAGVHLWYEAKFGYPMAPIDSIEDAIGLWPETATAVGVRLEADDSLALVAPCGLDDLFGLLLRRNPRQVTVEHFRRRAVEKAIKEKWPKVTIVDD